MSDGAEEYSDRSTGGRMTAFFPTVDSFPGEKGMTAIIQVLNL